MIHKVKVQLEFSLADKATNDKITKFIKDSLSNEARYYKLPSPFFLGPFDVSIEIEDNAPTSQSD